VVLTTSGRLNGSVTSRDTWEPEGEIHMRADEILADKVNETEVNGVVVRKGSVGAFLINARTLSDPAASDEARSIAERDIIEALPALRALGLFDILQIRDERLRAFVETH
jgi:hypothetical protein